MVERETLLNRVANQLSELNEVVLEMVDVIEHLTAYIGENQIEEPASEEELNALPAELENDPEVETPIQFFEDESG